MKTLFYALFVAGFLAFAFNCWWYGAVAFLACWNVELLPTNSGPVYSAGYDSVDQTHNIG